MADQHKAVLIYVTNQRSGPVYLSRVSERRRSFRTVQTRKQADPISHTVLIAQGFTALWAGIEIATYEVQLAFFLGRVSS
jgi:hypothetical protein